MRELSQEKRVIIIGAGASGISAARTLISAGVVPVILEARDRMGGRLCKSAFVKNLDSKNDDGAEVTIQLGANWIHGLDDTVNPFYAVAKKLNLNLHSTSPDDYPGDDVSLYSNYEAFWEENCDEESSVDSVSHGSNRVPAEDYKRMLARYVWIVDSIETCELCRNDDVSLSKVYEHLLAMSEDPKLPFGKCSKLHKRCINWCFDRVCIDFALPLDEISVKYFIGSESDGEFGEALVEGGFYRIFEQLVHEVAEHLDIRYHHVVNGIKHDDQGVTVTCSNGLSFDGEAVIVTTPVGVLQSGCIEFCPRPLALERLCSLKFGIMNLVWLWYPYQFWPCDCNYIGVARSDDSKDVTFSTFLCPPMMDQYGVSQPILMAQTFGNFALKVESLPNEEIAAMATAALRTIFGVNVPDAVGCRHSAWRSDEFARGSWSCPGISEKTACPFFSDHIDVQAELDGVVIAGSEICPRLIANDHSIPHSIPSVHNSCHVLDIAGSPSSVTTIVIPGEALSIVTSAADLPAMFFPDTTSIAMSIPAVADGDVGTISTGNVNGDGECVSTSNNSNDCSSLNAPITVKLSAPIANAQYVSSVGCTPSIDNTESRCVFFAGEATNYTHQGTAHGAYISGIKAGADVLRLFGISKETPEYAYLKHA